jgi:hypothetical protein
VLRIVHNPYAKEPGELFEHLHGLLYPEQAVDPEVGEMARLKSIVKNAREMRGY